ncbi:MAG: PilW family protein [Gallionella sp.]|nr:PilW family protein [Gallionella sp.]MDD4959950.1 PilW family protein [Gallionella sp.]
MRTKTQQSGFSLIEILIGMTIGLIVILVIMQTMSLFEGQRKTSSSAADMQSNGLLSLYSLEQDVRLAGYGLIANYQGVGDLPCLKINGYGTAPGVFDATPILINTSGVQDSITISRLEVDMGGLVTGGQAARFISSVPNQASLLAATGLRIDATPGAISGVRSRMVGSYPAGATGPNQFTYTAINSPADTVLVASASGVAAPLDCSLVAVSNLVSGGAYIPEVINTSGVSAVPVVVGSWSAVSVSQVGWDGIKVPGSIALPMSAVTSAVPASSVMSFVAVNNAGFDTSRTPVFPAGGYPVSSVLHNLGANPALIRTTFAVNQLRQFTKQINNFPAEVIAENIVSIQAQYGTAAVGSSSINCWVNPTWGLNPNSGACPGGSTANWSAAGLQASKTNMKRIKAIRVAIVARNNLREKATQGTCTTTPSAPISWLNGPVIDLTADPEWQCYRYKVYQTIIPLHNVILGNL